MHAANAARPGELAYAILVSGDQQSPKDPSVPQLQARDLIRYRQGDRLAVVHGRVPEIASFVGAFREAMSQTYPQAAADEVSLDTLSRAAVTLLLDGIGVESHDITFASELVRSALRTLELAYSGAPQGARSWNSLWFEHVSAGLANLSRRLIDVARGPLPTVIDVVFEEVTFGAFGLPRPNNGRSYACGEGRVGAEFASAFATWWSDAQTIVQTAGLVAKASGADLAATENHCLLTTDWMPFDRFLVVSDSHLAAWVHTVLADQPRNSNITELTEREFFRPIAPNLSGKPLRIQTIDGPAGLGGAPEAGPFIVRAELESGRFVTEEIRVHIPTIGTPSFDEVGLSAMQIRDVSGVAIWNGRLESDSGRLELIGRFEFEEQSFGSSDSRGLKVALQLDPEDSLFQVVPPSVPVTLYVAKWDSYGLIAVKLNSRGAPTGRPIMVAPDFTTSESGATAGLAGEYSDGASRHRIVVWGKDGDLGRFEGQPMPPLWDRRSLFMVEVFPQDLDVFEIGGLEIEMRAPESARSYFSPLLAAAHGQGPSDAPLPPETIRSLRGRYEQRSVESAGNASWLDALGHVALTADGDESIDDCEITEFGVMLPGSARAAWRENVDARVPRDLIESAAAKRFRAAYLAVERIAVGEQLRWPSRTSRQQLWQGDRSSLTEYLDSYVALMKEAHLANNSFATFWATYPFSMSVWSMDKGECEAVYVSPLHPIRLAWLAGVEATLLNAADAASLMGAVEGWAFPIVGPSETGTGRVLAVPSDNGTDQIFLGWSALIAVSTDRFQSLRAPVRVGPIPAPGTTASGLNAAAVSTALRNYRRMNPHVAGLTIDLAAPKPTARLREIDDAVVGAVRVWGRSDAHLLGGARVLDSTNRIGAAPLEGMTRLIRETPKLPLVWSRYEHVDGRPRTSNIRLLQDTGAKICVYPNGGREWGVIGQVPLRRFEVTDASFDEPKTVSQMPGIAVDAGWKPLTNALRSIESMAGVPRVASRLTSSLIADGNADWTVSGESMLSPSSMAAILEASGGNRHMLWEWRPPVFEKTDGTAPLERRPYVTVARVPQRFRRQLGDLLSRAQGAEASEAQIDSLLNGLGARGVGLSALLSMGGTHASGALGFSLGFALVDSARSTGSDRFVLPIDACDAFLKALAGSNEHAGHTQRADLLIVDISDEAITLVPVEIKFYGLNADEPSPILPGPSSTELKDPFSQLAATMTLLSKIESRGAQLASTANSADRYLWLNALASLVDAGARLRPRSDSTPENFVRRFRRVLDGLTPLRVGRPVLAYFGHDAQARDGGVLSAFTGARPDSNAQDGYGVLAANSAAAFEQSSSGPDAPIVKGWRTVLDWALGSAQNVGVAEVEYAPVPADIDQTAEQVTTEADRPIGELTQGDSADTGRGSFGVRFAVGELLGSIGRGEVTYWPSNTDLNQMNVGVVGDLGVGKTQLLKSLVFNLRRGARVEQGQPLSFLVFDYKRDFQDEDFADAVGASILRPNRIPLNVFALRNGYSKLAVNQRANMFCDVLDKIYGGVGPVQRNNLVEVITDLYGDGSGPDPTLASVLDAYKQAVPRADAVIGVLNTFVLGEIFSDDPSELVPFEQLIDDRVLVIALNELGSDQNGKNALVALFLNIYYDYMQSSTKWPYEGSAPKLRKLNSFLLVDEAVNIMRYNFPVLMDIMLQGREFGFGTILASQYLGHFRNSQNNYGEPLLTWFIHKVPNVSDRELTQLGLAGIGSGTSERISRQGVHEAFYRSLGFPGVFISGTPFFRLIEGIGRE
nr:hypothetical protein [Leifsonia sp. Leaf325]